MNINPFYLAGIIVISVTLGSWLGFNLGVGMSLTQGPVKTCEGMRYKIIICETK